jgi:hypothetical protein
MAEPCGSLCSVETLYGSSVNDYRTRALPTARAGSCESCGCRLSRYRPGGRRTCLACGGPDVYAKTREASERVLLALEDGPHTAREISKALQLTQRVAKDALSRLREAGQVEIDPASPYRAPRYSLRGS